MAADQHVVAQRAEVQRLDGLVVVVLLGVQRGAFGAGLECGVNVLALVVQVEIAQPQHRAQLRHRLGDADLVTDVEALQSNVRVEEEGPQALVHAGVEVNARSRHEELDRPRASAWELSPWCARPEREE